MTTLARRASAAALLGVVLVTGAVHAGHGPTLGADDHGQYLLHAKALVDGRAYSDIGFIHTRYSTKVAPIAEPPGLPVLIAGVMGVAGERTQWVRGILYASFALLGVVLFLYMRTLADTATSAVATAFSLTALARAHVLDTMMADIPFCLALWACFLLIDQKPLTGAGRLMLVAVVGALAFSFRMAALPLLPAAATALLLRPRNERPGFLTLGIVWTLVAAAIMIGLRSGAVLGGETLRSPGVFMRDVAFNIHEMLTGVRLGMPVSLPNRWLNIFIHAALLIVTLIGAVLGVRHRYRRFAWITAAWYVVMLIVLPTASSRYMWPLFPLLALSFIDGSRWVIRALTRRQHDALPLAAASVLIAVGVAQDTLADPPRTYARDGDIASVRAALASEASGSSPLRVMFFSPRVMTWEDGYVTMAPFAAAPSELLSVLRSERISHVVIGDGGTGVLGMSELQAATTAEPAQFRDVFRNNSYHVLALMHFATKE